MDLAERVALRHQDQTLTERIAQKHLVALHEMGPGAIVKVKPSYEDNALHREEGVVLAEHGKDVWVRLHNSGRKSIPTKDLEVVKSAFDVWRDNAPLRVKVRSSHPDKELHGDEGDVLKQLGHGKYWVRLERNGRTSLDEKDVEVIKPTHERWLKHLQSYKPPPESTPYQTLRDNMLFAHTEVVALTFPREFHLPPHAKGTPPTNPAGTDLYIWTWEEPTGPQKIPGFYVVIFAGKANNPLQGPFWYKSEQQRQKLIDDTVAARTRFLASKAKKQEERRNLKHGLDVGDILYSSWGYDQTNVDFYQVTKVMGKDIEVREIGARVVSHGHGSDKVMAEPNEFIGPPMRKRPQGYGSEHIYVNISSSQIAHEWEGQPVHQTAAGFGH